MVFWKCQGKACGDIAACDGTRPDPHSCYKCNNPRVPLPDGTVFSGGHGLTGLFCCPLCNTHWTKYGLNPKAICSRCHPDKHKDALPLTLSPVMYGIGWVIHKFMGGPPGGVSYYRPPPRRDSPPHSSTLPTFHKLQPQLQSDRTAFDEMLEYIKEHPKYYELEFFRRTERLFPFLSVRQCEQAAEVWLTSKEQVGQDIAHQFVVTSFKNRDRERDRDTLFKCVFCEKDRSQQCKRVCDGGRGRQMHSLAGCADVRCISTTTCNKCTK